MAACRGPERKPVTDSHPGSTLNHVGSSQGLRASEIGQNFQSNIDRVKNQGAKQVEGEYIKALQEEIKILEYQLKILKDKEIEQQAAVSQIDRFFSDGVPLNDNILAIKTQYQIKKTEEEKMIDRLREEIMNQEKNALDTEASIKMLQANKVHVEKEKERIEEDMHKLIDE